MAPLFLIAALTTVGGFSYDTVTLIDRTQPVASASKGYRATWKEHVEAIQGRGGGDRLFSVLMWQEALQVLRDYNAHGGVAGPAHDAGYIEASEDVTAASPDIVSVSVGGAFYLAGMAHPNGTGTKQLIWSRRLSRLVTQEDVFAVAPDRALRRLALLEFDNRDGLDKPDDPEGLPLPWDHASIGPKGITWSFDSYELGGYLAYGGTTIPWSALKPYLRNNLPFAINAIRARTPPKAQQ